MRVMIWGISGAGKTTLARRIAARFGLPRIELDAINWQAGWRDLNRDDRAEFLRRVAAAIEPDAWVIEGSYNSVRDMIWRRATHLIWLDYERPTIMVRVTGRSVMRIVLRTELWPGTGNRERWGSVLRPSHPIRWAWRTWRRRREETEALLRQPEYAHLHVQRLRSPREARRAVERLLVSEPDPQPSD
jgi:adenylate kinase family enzyme